MSTGAGLATGLVVVLFAGFVYGTLHAYHVGRVRAGVCQERLVVPAHRHAFDRPGNVWDQCR
jgi:hypothetical protein